MYSSVKYDRIFSRVFWWVLHLTFLRLKILIKFFSFAVHDGFWTPHVQYLTFLLLFTLISIRRKKRKKVPHFSSYVEAKTSFRLKIWQGKHHRCNGLMTNMKFFPKSLWWSDLGNNVMQIYHLSGGHHIMNVRVFQVYQHFWYHSWSLHIWVGGIGAVLHNN